MWAVVGLSGVIARVKVLWSGGPNPVPTWVTVRHLYNVIGAHENAGHCRFNRACELLRAVGLV